MIAAAAASGVNAVKLQKRNNKILYTKKFFNTIYNSENNYGRTYGEHREKLEFGINEYRELKAYANYKKLDFFATPFDFESVDFLEKLGVPLYKISSADLNNLKAAASALVSPISSVDEDLPVVVLPAEAFMSYVSKYPDCATAASVATTYCC